MEKKVKFLILMVSVFILVFGLFANFVLSQCDPPCEEPYAFDDDGGDVPSVAGMCTRFSERCEWVGPEIWECDSTVSNFPDSCTGNTLTEFFPIDGRFCTSKTYDCPTVFGAGYACQGGACVACTNDCGAEGLRQCSGIYGDVQECRANWDGDVCFEWGTIESCAANEECRGARCIDPGTCECEGCAFTFDGFASADDTDVDFVGVRFAPPGECMSELTEDNCNNAEGYFPECSEYCSTVCPEMGYVDCDCEKSPECSSQLDCEIDSGPGYGSTWCYSCDNGDCWYADRGTLCTVKRLGIPSPPPPLHGQCDGGDRCSCWDGMSCNVDMDCEICDDLYSPDDYCCSPSSGCKPYRTREIYDATESDGLGFGGDSNDRACCNNANDCVYNGECFTGGNYYDLNGDGLNEALCYSSNGRWISTDYHTSYCTANNYQWNVGTGDANIDNAYNPTYSGYDWPEGCKGHPDYASTMCCCGDDSGENYRTMSCSSGCSSNSNDRACCNNGNDCVYSGTCYSQGSLCAPWNSDAIGSCSSSTWSQTENCATKASENSGDAGNAPTVYGSCIDYITCEPSGPSCTSSTYNDVCVSGTQLTEYYASGASCLSATYTCPDFEVAATGDIANDPTTTGTCTAGTAAGCSSEAFSTAAGTGSGTEGCVDSNECFSNGGAGGGNCIFTEYYAVDSGDACTGLDSCASTTYDPDTNSNTCNECAGSNRFGIGGEDCNGAAAGDCSTQCCGDDSGENKRTCQDGGAGACTESTDDEACCSDSNACVYDGVCYSHDEATGGWACNQGTWERLEVIVVVIATPDSVKTVWQNTDATASIDCTPHPSTECDPNSYRLRIYTTTTSTCSTDYDTYSTPGTQTISSHSWVCGAAKDNYGTEGFSDSVEFRVDQINPTASLDSLPAWTTQSSVTVDWSGSDTGGSGINQFELEYRVTMVDGSVVQDWADWTTSSSNPGTLPFSDMQNNRTYHFRVRATDNAGNTGGWSSIESIGVDMVDPTCQVGDLPIYTTSSSFIVSWSGSDGESGIQYYNIQVRVGESGTWGYLNDPDGYHTTETWDNVNGADGNTYFFRCNATDVAGNEGAWSAVKNTTVDATDPISSVDPLPEWLNVTNFTVSWSGNDGGGSGIDCYDINWSDGSGWNDWFACTQITSSMFGPDSPVSVTEGVTYSFSSRARDVAGNVEEWPPQPDAYTTIDLTPPQYDLRAYDQDGREIIGYVHGVETVTIRSNTNDSISGIEHNYINYILLNDVGETTGSQDCGSASPYGGISECNITIDFAGVITLEFWVEVIDRAGNIVISDVLCIGTHPLANFREHNVYMSMGETTIMGIQVRNTQNQVDNVTITLSSNLPVAPHFVWVDDPDVEITGNNQTLIVRNLNPGATPPPFHVMVWSPDETRNYRVTLNASSALDITDSDDAVVQVGYPASFPGLNEWAIFVLIIVAVLGYIGLGKEMH